MTTTARPARRGRPGYDRESLLRVAVEVFNERGYDGTSMDDLARRLGITKAAIYHHVAGKEELLRLAVDRALDGLFALAAEVQAADGRAIDRLERLVRGSVAVLADRLPFVTLLLRVRGNTPVERAALARRREFDRLVTGLVAQAQADGDLRDLATPDATPGTPPHAAPGATPGAVPPAGPRATAEAAREGAPGAAPRAAVGAGPAVTARLLFGMVNSLVEWYTPDGPVDPATLADAVCAVAFSGLRRPAG